MDDDEDACDSVIQRFQALNLGDLGKYSYICAFCLCALPLRINELSWYQIIDEFVAVITSKGNGKELDKTLLKIRSKFLIQVFLKIT